jgi:hypothetical protein
MDLEQKNINEKIHNVLVKNIDFQKCQIEVDKKFNERLARVEKKLLQLQAKIELKEIIDGQSKTNV